MTATVWGVRRSVARGPARTYASRRFRASVLRKARVPEALIGLWLGHAGKSVTDDYVLQLNEDVEYRKEWANRVELGYVGLQKIAENNSEKAA
ncbi:MAG TPA: hypothetical protein VK525_09420 [Candidatus Saccharimonadales bacterium]|nr:hypothetical protein [Candidatus Saccharimonadales bacterium]